jgi:hypothetical protein
MAQTAAKTFRDHRIINLIENSSNGEMKRERELKETEVKGKLKKNILWIKTENNVPSPYRGIVSWGRFESDVEVELEEIQGRLQTVLVRLKNVSERFCDFGEFQKDHGDLQEACGENER